MHQHACMHVNPVRPHLHACWSVRGVQWSGECGPLSGSPHSDQHGAQAATQHSDPTRPLSSVHHQRHLRVGVWEVLPPCAQVSRSPASTINNQTTTDNNSQQGNTRQQPACTATHPYRDNDIHVAMGIIRTHPLHQAPGRHARDAAVICCRAA